MTSTVPHAVSSLPWVAYDKGHQVDLFFNDDGVLWADKTRGLETGSRAGDSPENYLPYLVENEVPIGV